MSIKDALKGAVKEAMKAKDKVRLDTVRGVLSAIQYDENAQNVDALPEPTVIEIVKREIKKRREESDFAAQAARPEAVATLAAEIAIIESFLPQQMSTEELERIIAALKDEDPSRTMGAVMKIMKERHSGMYDAKQASEIAKRIAG